MLEILKSARDTPGGSSASGWIRSSSTTGHAERPGSASRWTMSSVEGGGAAKALFATRSVEHMWSLPSFNWRSSSGGIGRRATARSMTSCWRRFQK